MDRYQKTWGKSEIDGVMDVLEKMVSWAFYHRGEYESGDGAYINRIQDLIRDLRNGKTYQINIHDGIVQVETEHDPMEPPLIHFSD